MASIIDLMLGAKDSGSNEYKEGWNCAVEYLNDNFIIQKRDGESISIVFDIELNEDELIAKFEKARHNEREQERV